MMTVGEKIKHLRITVGITQDDLAKILCVHTDSVEQWEHGKVNSIPLSKIKAMAKTFNVNPFYLAEDDADN